MQGQQCLEFVGHLEPAEYPSPVPSDSMNPAEGNVIKDCHRLVKRDDYSCVTIETFSDLKAEVKRSHGDVMFCAFTIHIGPSDLLDIEKNVNLICIETGQCRIKGSRQIRIIGPRTQVFIQGFVFEAASVNAVQILSSAILTQTFCDCQFLRYVCFPS